MPGEESFGALRLAIPFLSKVLALRGFIPDEPLIATIDASRLNRIRHVANHVEQQVEFVVILSIRDAPFVAPRKQRGDDHRKRGQVRIVDERHVTVAFRDLHCAPEDALKAAGLRIRLYAVRSETLEQAD